MTSRGRVALLAAAGLVAATAGAAADGTPSALDKPAMAATASELLALARAAPADGADVVVLRDERDASFDEHGRAITHRRSVFVVRTQGGIDGWGTVHAEWRTSYQDPPVVRARVIDPGGTIAVLDPRAPGVLAAPPSPPGSPWGYTELMLPALQIGSVVEHDVVTTDREPALAAGGLERFELGDGPPTARTVITLSAPAGRHAHHVARALPPGARVSHRVAQGREIWRTELAAMPAAPTSEVAVPSDAITAPYVGLSTAESWTTVAAAYRALIEQRLRDGAFALPVALPRAPSVETVAAITAWLHRTVQRPADDASLVLRLPASPATTVRRGVGCDEDRAALLLTLLRQAGVGAELVLVATGEVQPDPDLPGLAGFDHVVLRARVGARELWIDPSEDLARPGELRAGHRGRRALVIAAETRGLIATPTAEPADNVIREVRTFVASEAGAARVTEVTRPTGAFEPEQRAWIRAMPADTLTQYYAAHARTQYAGTAGARTTTAVGDLATPFAITLEVAEARRAVTGRERIDVYLEPSATLAHVPRVVRDRPERPRRSDFAWPTPHVHEIENRIVVPAGYALPAPAPDRTRAIGTARFTEHQHVAGQTFVVRFRFDSGKPRLTAAELAQLRDAIAALAREVVHVEIARSGAAGTRPASRAR